MRSRFSFIGLMAAAAAGLGLHGVSAKISASGSSVVPKPRARRPKIGDNTIASPQRISRTTVFRDTGAAERDRLAKRAENDLRACRLNYPGWCGYEESGQVAGLA